MFANWTSNSNPSPKTDPKSVSPTLRTDIYAAFDKIKPWLIGAQPSAAGDGVSYQPILTLIHHHFPDLDLALDAIGNIDAEVALLVAGITNMVLEMSKWDGMAGAMTMRTWVDALCDAHARIIDSNAARGTGRRKELVGQGITHGINQLGDVSLMTREFAPRIQIISLLKSVNTRVHGAGSEAARQGEALWSSKFI